MANCPCPRCLIPKHRIHQLATRRDQRQRKSLARMDNLQYRVKISSAREIIYKNKCAVESVYVQRLLKPESLVPNEVLFSSPLSDALWTNCYPTECILIQTFPVWIQFV